MSRHSLSTLSIRLKQAVVAAGGTRRIALATGVSEAMLYRYYLGKPVPSDRLMRLARACHVSVAWLFGEPPFDVPDSSFNKLDRPLLPKYSVNVMI